MSTQFARVIGVDVSKKFLDVNDSSGMHCKRVENEVETIEKWISKIELPEQTLVVCEATGGYEHILVDLLHDAKVNVAVVNPRQTRSFAQARGTLEKSDKIDAHCIRLFGEQIPVHLAKPRTAQEKAMQALSRRREQVLTLISQEKNRLQQSHDAICEKFIKKSLQMLTKQLEQINDKLAACVAELAKTDAKVEVLESVPGVGTVTTVTLCCELPELGTLTRGEVAKLVGVAPIIHQSGTRDGKRKPRGGRANVRTTLYMATLVATQHNPKIKEKYQQLLSRGKPKKVALVACMRKLLVMLNEMVRNKQVWDPNRKGVNDNKSKAPIVNAACSTSH